MTTLENIQNEKYNEIMTSLRNAGFEGSLSMSTTDFGMSLYFMVDGVKVRISDHSVENTYRMQNERHFKIEKYNEAIEYFEKIVHPERFDIVYTGQVINGIKIRKYVRK